MHNFKNPTRIIYGKGSFSRLEWVLEAFAPEKALVVVGGKSMEREGYLGKLKGCLDCETVLHHVSHEPSVKVIEEGVSKSKDTDVVVGLGGGSVLDAAKAIAILLKNDVRLNDVLNSKAKLSKPGVPLIAVPSTSGTGSEVTRVSVVGDTGENFKQSFRTEDMYPHTAVVDPELTLSCPPNVTASAGLDALSHALESFTTKSPTPITSPLAFRAMELIHKNLLKAFEDGSDIEAREGMSYASLLAGLAISNSGLGMVHGIAHALGFRYNIPHGVCCGFLLPYSVEYNSSSTKNYDVAARAFHLNGAKQLSQHLFDLNEKLGLKPKLKGYGVSEEDFQWIAEHSFSGSMRANPREMKVSDVVDLLARMA